MYMNKAPMERLADLDRKAKHAALRAASKVLAQPTPDMADEFKVARKKGVGSRGQQSLNSSIIAHVEGPVPCSGKDSRQQLIISAKPSAIDPRKVGTEFLHKKQPSRGEAYYRTRNKLNVSNIF